MAGLIKRPNPTARRPAPPAAAQMMEGLVPDPSIALTATYPPFRPHVPLSPKTSSHRTRPAVGTDGLMQQEQALEARGGPKTAAERRLEREISRQTGKPYVGNR